MHNLGYKTCLIVNLFWTLFLYTIFFKFYMWNWWLLLGWGSSNQTSFVIAGLHQHWWCFQQWRFGLCPLTTYLGERCFCIAQLLTNSLLTACSRLAKSRPSSNEIRYLYSLLTNFLVYLVNHCWQLLCLLFICDVCWLVPTWYVYLLCWAMLALYYWQNGSSRAACCEVHPLLC